MSAGPLVSAIIIFLNAERFIREAIESVHGQTYASWEVLLVDDGSTDDSSRIAQECAAMDPERVRYLEHPGHLNRGMSASRNLGIRHAGGDYIAFLDSDDVWLGNKLQDQVSILELYPQVAMVYGKALYWHGWTGQPEDAGRDHLQEHGVQADVTVDGPVLLRWFLEGRAAIPPPSSIMLRRTSLERTGWFDESFRGLYEDQAFYAKVCFGESVFVANQSWELYRQHSESSCARGATSNEDRFARIAFLCWLRELMTERSIRDSHLSHALNRAVWAAHHPSLARLSRGSRRLIRSMKTG